MEQDKSPEAIEKRMLAAIAEFGGIEESRVTREADLEALDVDSLDLVELAQIVEEEYGVRVETKDFDGVETVGAAVDVVLGRLDVTATAAP